MRAKFLQQVFRIGLFLAPIFLSGVTPAQVRGKPAEQKQTGALRGTVSATLSGVKTRLAGIGVKAVHEPAAGAGITTNTDANGEYQFPALAAGVYTISIEAAGFKPAQARVVLRAGQRAVQDFALELKTVSEKVVVKATPPESKKPNVPTAVVSQPELLTLPTREERVQEVIPLTPGVIQQQNGQLAFKGAEETQSLMLINAVRATDPVTGSFWIPVPTDAVQSLAVDNSPYDASLGNFAGGLTSVETRPPADRLRFGVRRVAITIQGKNGHMEGIASANPTVSLDAPIVRHKLLFSEVFQYEMKKTTVEGLPWPHDVRKRQGFNSFSTLEAILAPNHLLTVTANVFPLRRQHEDISALVPEPASNDLNQSGASVGVSDKYQFGSGALLSFVAAYTRLDSNAHGQGFADMLITPEGWGGNYFNRWSRRGKEFEFLPTYQFAGKGWGKHEIRIGAEVDWRSYFGTTASHPIQILREDGNLAEGIDFGPAAVQRASNRMFSEFVQDRWMLNSQISLDLGARFSSETAGWSAAISPRVALAYSPGKEGRTTFRAGGGVFYGVLPLLAADFAENPVRTITQFDEAGVPIGAPISLTSVYAGQLNPLAAPILPARPGTTPRNITWNAGVDREITKNVVVHAGYLDSHASYLFVVNPFTSEPGRSSFLALTNTGSSHYQEFSASLRYVLHGRSQLKASYIRSKARGDLNSLSSVYVPFEAPVIRPDVYGILPADIPNRFIGWGIFQLPWKLVFSPLVDVHSGYPYSAIDVEQQYVGVPNSRRFPTFFSLDLKLYREFRMPFFKSHHIRLGLYSLNVTNHGNFLSVYNNVASPAFGQFAGFVYRRDGMIIDLVD